MTVDATKGVQAFLKIHPGRNYATYVNNGRDCSVANVSQLTVVDRGRLTDKAGVLSARLLSQVEDGVRQVLAL